MIITIVTVIFIIIIIVIIIVMVIIIIIITSVGAFKKHTWLPTVPTSQMSDTQRNAVHAKVSTTPSKSNAIAPLQHTRTRTRAHAHVHVHPHVHPHVNAQDFQKKYDQFQDTEHTKQDDITLSTRTGDSRSFLKDENYRTSNTNSTRSSIRKSSIDWFDAQSAMESCYYDPSCSLGSDSKDNFESILEKGEWVEFFDESAQANYWFNKTTGEASWVPPDSRTRASSYSTTRSRSSTVLDALNEQK